MARIANELVALVERTVAGLGYELVELERFGHGLLRVTLDTPAGSDGGITLDSLSLATRLISRELDHEDPIAGHYTLEVTSPGLERQLRTPAHFQREVGKTVTIRLRDPKADPRRIQGALTAADERTATLLLDDGTERIVPIDDVDKARTVFEWGPKPKPGKQPSGSKKKTASNRAAPNQAAPNQAPSNKEKQAS